MTQEYARVSIEMPENKDRKSLRQELTYEIDNKDWFHANRQRYTEAKKMAEAFLC